MKGNVLVYFGIRARADNIRYALALRGIEYEDHRPTVDFDGRDEVSGTPLFKGEYKSYTPFGNLPYWKDESVSIAQTPAILNHIGRKHDLYGKNDTERLVREYLVQVTKKILYRAYIDQLVFVGEEIVNSFFPVVRFPTFNENLPTILHGQRGILKRLEQIQNLLNVNRNKHQSSWFVGESISIADCEMYHVVNNWIRPLPGDILRSFPEIEKFRRAFEGEEEIQKFIISGKRPKTTLPAFAGGLNNPEDFK